MKTVKQEQTALVSSFYFAQSEEQNPDPNFYLKILFQLKYERKELQNHRRCIEAFSTILDGLEEEAGQK